MRLCECGCGMPAPIAKQSDSKRGYVKGQPVRFQPGHNQQRRRVKGYYTVCQPSHPKATTAGDVYEHIAVAERALGRYLPDGAEVHHVDGNQLNNANRNLVICQDRAYHKLLHVRQRVVDAGGNPNIERICGTCKHLLPFSAFYRMASNKSTGVGSRCRSCGKAAWAGYQRLHRRRAPGIEAA
jgi:hypothetical protein